MSDTPRTDAAIKQRHRDRWNGKTPAIIESSVGEDFTRQLERELAALKTQLEQMDDERLSWKMEAEQRGKALAAARADTEMLDWLLDGMDVYGPVYALRYHPRTRYANRQAITKAMEESKERFCKQLK